MNPFARVYDFWLGIPDPMREQTRSFGVSLAFGGGTALGTLYSAWYSIPLHGNVFPNFLHYLATPASFGAITAAVAAFYRGHQAKRRADNTVTLDNGTKAIIIPPKN